MKAQRTALKWLYVAALANTVLLAIWGAIFEVPGVISFVGPQAALGGEILPGVEGFLLISFVVAMAPLVFLIRRPMWWGKPLLPVYGLSWVGHAAMLPFVLSNSAVHVFGLWVPAACGLGMFGLAIAHQIVDPNSSHNRATPDS